MTQITVFGAGIVGQATGKGFAKRGHAVHFVDVNPQRLQHLREQGYHATTAEAVDWSRVEVVMIAVPTPDVNERVDLRYIEAAAREIGNGLARTDRYVMVVVRSTVPPTTTEQLVAPILEAQSGKRVGRDFGIAMNPEFLRQATNEQDFARPWVTVLGTSDRRCAELLDRLYAPFGALIVHCTPTEAEMIKYVNNCFNAVKISYFNEVHQMCEALGLDSNRVTAAVARSAESMWNPLYGTRGGVPFGGACLPKDTNAFLAFAEDRGWEHLMLQATIEVNRRLAERVPPVSRPDDIETALALSRRNGHDHREAAHVLELPQLVTEPL